MNSIADRIADLAKAVRVAALRHNGISRRLAVALADDLGDIAADARREEAACALVAEADYQGRRAAA